MNPHTSHEDLLKWYLEFFKEFKNKPFNVYESQVHLRHTKLAKLHHADYLELVENGILESRKYKCRLGILPPDEEFLILM